LALRFLNPGLRKLRETAKISNGGERDKHLRKFVWILLNSFEKVKAAFREFSEATAIDRTYILNKPSAIPTIVEKKKKKSPETTAFQKSL
jgi:hypothetical protein